MQTYEIKDVASVDVATGTTDPTINFKLVKPGQQDEKRCNYSDE
ncbi:hypothetical protein [[Mycoplasma] imitans]|nr:hypothetical protein [[Mycoplasma] imitans]